VDSVWDLVNGPNDYDHVVPVLFRHLEAGGYPDRVMEGIARSLAVPASAPFWHRLRDLYLRARGPDEEMGLAAALVGSATRNHYDDLVSLFMAARGRDTRVAFIRPMVRVNRAEAMRFLESIATDPEVAPEIEALMRRRRRKKNQTRSSPPTGA
jgi:hypothetical protein